MITPQRVESILMDCLSGDESVGLKVEGILHTFMLSPEKLATHRAEIVEMLAQMNPMFFDDGTGGGWSFLNLCETADGTLWTGEHRAVEQLCALAIGLDLAGFVGSREMWEAFPGGMPYVQIKRSKFADPAG
jgi:hypothetical protein